MLACLIRVPGTLVLPAGWPQASVFAGIREAAWASSQHGGRREPWQPFPGFGGPGMALLLHVLSGKGVTGPGQVKGRANLDISFLGGE